MATAADLMTPTFLGATDIALSAKPLRGFVATHGTKWVMSIWSTIKQS